MNPGWRATLVNIKAVEKEAGSSAPPKASGLWWKSKETQECVSQATGLSPWLFSLTLNLLSSSPFF